MKKQRLALVLASIWMFGGIANAAITDSSWYVVPQVGALIPDSNLKTGNTFFAGVKAGTELNEKLDVQIGASFSGEADVDYPDLYSGGSYSQSLISLEALYLFSRSDLRPFVSAGAVIAFDKFDYKGVVASNNGSGTETSFGGSLGGGVQYSFSKTGFVQADVRYVMSSPDFSNGASIKVDKNSNIYAGLGVGFRFGKPMQSLPAVEELPEEPLVAVAGVNVCEDTGSCKKPEPKVEPKPEVKPVTPPPPVKTKVLTKTLRADASFASGSSVLTKRGQKALDAAIAAEGLTYERISKLNDLELTIVGHASRTGKESVNQKLSVARAEAVKKYLVKKGVAASAIKTEGRGSSEPVTKPEDCKKFKGKKLDVCLAPDRRVELSAQATVVTK